MQYVHQVQAIVDHHHNVDVKTATKVRFQEPGKETEHATEAAPAEEEVIQSNNVSKVGTFSCHGSAYANSKSEQ